MPASILVLDDDPSLQELFREILQEDGYTVTIRSRPPALAALAAQPPDLILLDYILGTSAVSVEFLNQVRADSRTAAIPVLLCSAAAAELQARAAWLAQHQIRVVSKPFDIDDLLRVVAECLAVAADPSPPLAA